MKRNIMAVEKRRKWRDTRRRENKIREADWEGFMTGRQKEQEKEQQE